MTSHEYTAEDGTVFSAELFSSSYGPWFRWVQGLPEALRTPGSSFTANADFLLQLTVSEAAATGGAVFRQEDGAVLCQITQLASHEAIAAFDAANLQVKEGP